MPKLLKTPFAVDAAEGFRTDIQESTGAAPNSATYQVGFPPVTMQSIASNGMPPKGSDLNGVLYDITDNLVFLTQGGGYGFDSAYATSIGGYPLNARLRLTNGDIVKSTIDGNTNDPNVDMTGWKRIENNGTLFLHADEIGLTKWSEFKKPPYTSQEYEQAYNNGVRLTTAIKAAHDAGYSDVVLERDNYPFCYANPTGGTFSSNREGAIKLRDLMRGIKIDLNWSNLFVIFDSVNRSPYDKSTTLQPYQLFGAIFDSQDSRNIKVVNGLIRGDQFNRSWVQGEDKTEQTYGAFILPNTVDIDFSKCTFYGFRGDGIGGAGRGKTIATLSTWYKGGIDLTTGVNITQTGAYNTGMLTLNRSLIIDDSIQVSGTGMLTSIYFRNINLRAFFYKANGTFIGSEIFKETDFLRLPVDCEKLNIVAYDDERTTDTVDYGLYALVVTGSSDGIRVTDCVFTQNHRGGISNNAGRGYIERCQFYDIGYQKYNFPDYGDPTRFGIDYENVYMNSLTVKDSYFRNIPQGVLGGVQNLRVEGSVFENILIGGTLAYGVNIALFKGNTYRNVGRAFGYQNSGMYLKKTIVAHDNILENCGAMIDVAAYPLVNFELRNNTFNSCNLIAKGNGKNLIVEGNTFRNPIESVNFNSSVDVQGAFINSNNTVITDLINTNYNYFAMYSAIGYGNTVISDRDNITRFREPLENISVDLRGVTLTSSLAAKRYQHRLTNKSKGWVNHVDILKHINCKFDKVQLEFYGLDGQNFYNTAIVFEDVIFKNTSRIVLTKREGAGYTTSTTDILVKNCTIDLTGAAQFIVSTYAQLGACTIKFINCDFIADTPVSLALIQGQTTNITSQAIGCRFINVTNTDSLTSTS